jgi:hypothetical protein
MPSLASDARVDESNVAQGNRRKPPSPRSENWRAKLLATTLAAPLLASTMLLSPGMGEAANSGRDGALLYPTANLTQLVAAHLRGTTHRDTLDADKAATDGPFVAGKHVAHNTKGAG